MLRRAGLVFLPLLVGIVWVHGVAPGASAQIPSLGDASEVSGTMASAGDYGATVGSAGQFFERSGTYDAAVSFEANVVITALDILTLSGGYEATGPFTATVSAPGIPPFVVTGTYGASGTFSGGVFTSAGQWVLVSGGAASGTHSGGGTYEIQSLTAFAEGQYQGTVTESPRGELTVDGPYSGSGTYTTNTLSVIVEGPTSASALQVSALADMIAGIAGLVASGPIAATAIEMQSPAVPAIGGFSGDIAPSGVSLTTFNGSLAQLANAAASADLTTVAATSAGRLYLYVVGAPTFVNTLFTATFPSGFSGSPVIVTR